MQTCLMDTQGKQLFKEVHELLAQALEFRRIVKKYVLDEAEEDRVDSSSAS